MRILGISAFHPDAAAVLLIDGVRVVSALESQFSGQPREARFPTAAIHHCLVEAGIQAADLDYVCFHERPRSQFQRFVQAFAASWPGGMGTFLKVLPSWLRAQLHVPDELRRCLGGGYHGPVLFADAAHAQAAGAYFSSAVQDAAFLVTDASGWASTALGIARGNQLELTHAQPYPHAFSCLLGALASLAGFSPQEEKEFLGLANDGEPKFAAAILDQAMKAHTDGSFRLLPHYFCYRAARVVGTRALANLLGGPPRNGSAAIGARERQLAASFTAVVETLLQRTVKYLCTNTGCSNLVVAGATAQLLAIADRIRASGAIKQVHAPDESAGFMGASGAALLTWYQILGNPRTNSTASAELVIAK